MHSHGSSSKKQHARTLPNKGTFISRNHGIIINNMPSETLNPGVLIVKGYLL